jgi:hypothetical protein
MPEATDARGWSGWRSGEERVMEGDINTIYGSSNGSLIGSVIGYFVGLLVTVGGFIFIARYLVGKRLQRFERDWRASHDKPEDDDPSEPGPDDKKPSSGW